MPYGTTDIRNIALVGQAGAGKTLLAEAWPASPERSGPRGRSPAARRCALRPPGEGAAALDAAVCGFETQGRRVNVIDPRGTLISSAAA